MILPAPGEQELDSMVPIVIMSYVIITMVRNCVDRFHSQCEIALRFKENRQNYKVYVLLKEIQCSTALWPAFIFWVHS